MTLRSIVPADIPQCAKLFTDVFSNPPWKAINPTFAQLRHERIHFGGKWGFENKRPKEN